MVDTAPADAINSVDVRAMLESNPAASDSFNCDSDSLGLIGSPMTTMFVIGLLFGVRWAKAGYP